MSSLNKQQKRAKRAKTKAKQHRVTRNTGATHTSDSSVFDPQVFPYFDDSLLGTTPLTENEFLDELFGPEEGDLFEEFTQEHLDELKLAEAEGQLEFLTAFLRGPMALNAIMSVDDDEDPNEAVFAALVRYWYLAQGIDPEFSYERIEQPDFLKDFNTAFDLVDEELAKMLAEEDDDDEDIERYLKKLE